MHKILGILAVIISLTACSKDEVYMQPVELWKAKDVKRISFDVKDAQQPKNLLFVIRNNNDYPYSNIFLISTIKQDKTKKTVGKTDTLKYYMADATGKWLGSGFGETKEILFQYKMDYKFPENGTYTVEIQQGMRKDDLPGIEDIGLRIETVK